MTNLVINNNTNNWIYTAPNCQKTQCAFTLTSSRREYTFFPFPRAGLFSVKNLEKISSH